MHASLLSRLHPSLRRFLIAALAAGIVLGLSEWNLVWAHIVIMKDGFTIQGNVKQESTVEVDPISKVPVAMPKGSFLIDDGARRISFSPRQVQDVTNADPNPQPDKDQFASPFVRIDNFRVPTGQFAGFTPWNEKWDRIVKLNTGSGIAKIAEHLSFLSPEFVRMDARQYNWSPRYLTRELDPDMVRDLLYHHSDLKLSGSDKEKDAAKRFRVFRFLVQAGWYEKGLAELDDILHDFPNQKEKVESSREELKKIVAAQFVELIERAQKVGRHAWAQEKLATFPQKDVEEKLLVRLRAVQSTYETGNKNLASARRLLEDQIHQIETSSSYRELFLEATAAITAELNLDTVGRLEPFLGLAEQAARDKEQKRTPSYSAEQLLALSVSGWLLGSGAAEAKVETAARLWQTRHFLAEYQKTSDSTARKSMLAAYEKSGRMAVDELAQLISLLPPAEPIPQVSLKEAFGALGTLPLESAGMFWALSTLQNPASMPRLEMQVDAPGSYRKGPAYLVQLPPEYHVGRSYPVLFVLHENREKPAAMLQRWSTLAAQNGYVLVAPEWERVHSMRGYQYSVEEQAAVVDVLRDLRRFLQIDSDRVFLFGQGQGGDMAFDVGLSHPDLFAGVLMMGGRPRYFAKVYWRNALNLPFYVIDGDMNADVAKDNRHLFENWVPRGYPSLYVQYKGRGIEWFDAELPYAFDWMSRKKRAFPVPELGKPGNGGMFGDEYQTMRPTDDHFYWLQGEAMLDRHVNDSDNWKKNTGPATLQARINEANQINVNMHGFKRGILWFRPGMIEFDKPVTIRINRTIYANRKITPSLVTLLEDFRARGDHQRLFLAKFEFDL